MFRSSPSSRRAFTLVELLVVIGVIAVLIAILMPALQSARAQSQAIKCRSNLRQIFMALNSYAADNKGYIVDADIPMSATYTGSPRWYQFIYNREPTTGASPFQASINYVGSGDVFYCPVEQRVSYSTAQVSYGLNDSMFNYNTTKPPRWLSEITVGANVRKYYNLPKTKKSAETFLMADSASSRAYLMRDNINFEPIYRHGKRSPSNNVDPASQTNMLFHDGHVSPMSSREIRVLPGYNYKRPWYNQAD